jgi:hypothetical protein
VLVAKQCQQTSFHLGADVAVLRACGQVRHVGRAASHAIAIPGKGSTSVLHAICQFCTQQQQLQQPQQRWRQPQHARCARVCIAPKREAGGCSAGGGWAGTLSSSAQLTLRAGGRAPREGACRTRAGTAARRRGPRGAAASRPWSARRPYRGRLPGCRSQCRGSACQWTRLVNVKRSLAHGLSQTYVSLTGMARSSSPRGSPIGLRSTMCGPNIQTSKHRHTERKACAESAACSHTTVRARS